MSLRFIGDLEILKFCTYYIFKEIKIKNTPLFPVIHCMWILGSEIDKLAGRKLQRESSTLSTSSIPVSKHPEVFKVSLSSSEGVLVSFKPPQVFKVILSSPEVLRLV